MIAILPSGWSKDINLLSKTWGSQWRCRIRKFTQHSNAK